MKTLRFYAEHLNPDSPLTKLLARILLALGKWLFPILKPYIVEFLLTCVEILFAISTLVVGAIGIITIWCYSEMFCYTVLFPDSSYSLDNFNLSLKEWIYMKMEPDFSPVYEGPMPKNPELINQFLDIKKPSSIKYPVIVVGIHMDMVYRIVLSGQASPTYYSVLTEKTVWVEVFI